MGSNGRLNFANVWRLADAERVAIHAPRNEPREILKPPTEHDAAQEDQGRVQAAARPRHGQQGHAHTVYKRPLQRDFADITAGERGTKRQSVRDG